MLYDSDEMIVPNSLAHLFARALRKFGAKKMMLYNHHILLQPCKWKLYNLGNKFMIKMKMRTQYFFNLPKKK